MGSTQDPLAPPPPPPTVTAHLPPPPSPEGGPAAAEADAALFALKGGDVTEIAALRGAAPGTVRAQLARVYAKAAVKSQSGLMALFIEELVETRPG